ncbi:hypothetical protein HPC49_21865 [Pyxidicoccus fallax]|uniref:Lipoprotein n=1 Tax=Pyxidicoccus fallax TaxID=394095 RepID=A0A848LNA8_9BACT|nr:hypothetical protein [Pyxidicoccus fallax]NMO19226.1 hypothetical protein [Pyxidicoccus fallax]NPC80859.1 hypothetical protein [Pyxidicoccus fallax]
MSRRFAMTALTLIPLVGALGACRKNETRRTEATGDSPVRVLREGAPFISIWKFKEEIDRAGGEKYKLEGPFNIGDPVHEAITLRALKEAGLVEWNVDETKDVRVRDYIAGVFWNDDPECKLFDTPDTLDFSDGIDWYGDLLDAEEAVSKKKELGPGTPILGRSHYGDLQFLHGMASRNDEMPQQTLERALVWMKFSYGVAIGETTGDDRLTDVELLRALFPGSTQTVSELFCVKQGKLERRAIGVLMHLLQDSYAAGHVRRQDLGGNRRGRIQQFYAYSSQDPSKHAADDAWRGGRSEGERLANVKGALDAVSCCREVLQLWSKRRPWPQVKAVLDQGCFALAPNAVPSAAGRDYEKR